MRDLLRQALSKLGIAVAEADLAAIESFMEGLSVLGQQAEKFQLDDVVPAAVFRVEEGEDCRHFTTAPSPNLRLN